MNTSEQHTKLSAFSRKISDVIGTPDNRELAHRASWNKDLAFKSFIVTMFSLFSQRLEVMFLSLGVTIGVGAYGFYQGEKAKKMAHEMCVQVSREFINRLANDSSVNLKAGISELGWIHSVADEYSVDFMHLLGDSIQLLVPSVGSDFYVYEGGKRYNFACQKVFEKWEKKYRNPKKHAQFAKFLTYFIEEIQRHKNDFYPTSFIYQLEESVSQLHVEK